MTVPTIFRRVSVIPAIPWLGDQVSCWNSHFLQFFHTTCCCLASCIGYDVHCSALYLFAVDAEVLVGVCHQECLNFNDWRWFWWTFLKLLRFIIPFHVWYAKRHLLRCCYSVGFRNWPIRKSSELIGTQWDTSLISSSYSLSASSSEDDSADVSPLTLT